MRNRVSLLAVSILLLAPATALAQCRVEGVVRLFDGTPLASAIVRLDASDYKQPLQTTTDANGRYVFESVKPGIWVRIVALQRTRPVARAYGLVTRQLETLDLSEQGLVANSDEYVTAAEGPAGEVAGVVNTADGQPIAGARLTIGETSLSAVTDSAGRYAIARLRPDIHVDLHASAEGFRSGNQPISVVEHDRVSANFTLSPGAESEPRLVPLSTLESSADSSRIVARPDQVTGVPSLIRNDLFRALQLRPGVAGVNESAELSVRGSTPDQTLIVVDGFTLYQFGGGSRVFSAYNMDTVERGEFSTISADANDGGRLASTLRLNGRTASARAWSGYADVSALGLNAGVVARLGNRVSLLVAGRRSAPASIYDDVLDRLAPTSGTAVRDRLARYSGGTLSTTSPSSAGPTLSHFRDWNARVDVAATLKDRLSFSLYDGGENINNSHDLAVPQPSTTLGVPEVDPLPTDTVVQVSSVSGWTSRGLGGTWRRRWSPSSTSTMSIGRSEYTRDSDQAWLVTSPATGADYSFTDARGGSDAITESNQVRDTTVRGETVFDAGFAHAVSIGAEVSSFEVGYASQTEVFRAGTPMTSGLVDLFRTTDTGVLTSVFARDSWRPTARLGVTPGLRIAHYDRSTSTYIEPRAEATYELVRGLRVKGAWAIDHQVVNGIAREDRLHGDGAFWTLADGVNIPVPRAMQFVAGGSLDVQGVLINLDAYTKEFDDVTLFAPRLYPGMAPGPGNSLFSNGSGRTRGIEALLQYKAPRNTIWASYALSRTEYTYPGLEAATFVANFDRPNEFKIVDAFQIMGGWSASGALVAASGRPYTPATSIESVWFSSGATVNEVVFGGRNSARLPPYHRLDLSTQHDFRIASVKTTVGGTVFNVYGRKNIQFYEYETAGQSLTAHGVAMMGRSLNLFFRVGI
jgi:ferric enterobactin receptor